MWLFRKQIREIFFKSHPVITSAGTEKPYFFLRGLYFFPFQDFEGLAAKQSYQEMEKTWSEPERSPRQSLWRLWKDAAQHSLFTVFLHGSKRYRKLSLAARPHPQPYSPGHAKETFSCSAFHSLWLRMSNLSPPQHPKLLTLEQQGGTFVTTFCSWERHGRGLIASGRLTSLLYKEWTLALWFSCSPLPPKEIMKVIKDLDVFHMDVSTS